MNAHPFLPRLQRSLVLASRSPRRRQLLEMQGLHFEVQPAAIDEAALADETPREQAERLALEKAIHVAAGRGEAAVIGSDTIVVVDDEVLGKPADEDEAESMLRCLSGRDHEVISAVALCCRQNGFEEVLSSRTRVRFRRLEPDEIASYARSGEPMDKAGSYGIQGLGALLVESIEGCYFTVMGLPLQRLRTLMWTFAEREKEGG